VHDHTHIIEHLTYGGDLVPGNFLQSLTGFVQHATQ